MPISGQECLPINQSDQATGLVHMAINEITLEAEITTDVGIKRSDFSLYLVLGIRTGVSGDGKLTSAGDSCRFDEEKACHSDEKSSLRGAFSGNAFRSLCRKFLPLDQRDRALNVSL